MQLKILIQNYPAAYLSIYAPFHYLNTALDDVRPIPSLSFIISCPLLHQPSAAAQESTSNNEVYH